jgi:hypothetical protein
MVVPDRPEVTWHRRAFQRRSPVWRIVERIEPADFNAWMGEAVRVRKYPHRPRKRKEDADWATLVIAFP